MRKVIGSLIAVLAVAGYAGAALAGPIVYRMNYTGDEVGTGVFIYDEAPGANRIVEWSWDFGIEKTGNIKISVLDAFSQSLMMDIRDVVTGISWGESIGFNRETIEGYPGSIRIPATNGIISLGVFTFGTRSDGSSGFWNWSGTGPPGGAGTLARGDFTISKVPTPASLALFAIGLVGLGWSGRKTA